MDFHKGEYVELATGQTGYIVIVDNNSLITQFVIKILTPASDKGKTKIVNIPNPESPASIFTRIGCHKFRRDEIKAVALDPYSTPTPLTVIQDKLNELAEAINKINEQLDKER